MKTKYLLIITVCTYFNANSQITSWQFGNPVYAGNEITSSASNLDGNLEYALLSRGNGITPSNLTYIFNSSSFKVNGTLADAISENEYYQIEIKSKTGYKFSLNTLKTTLKRSGTGPNNYIWKYSLDGINFTNISNEIAITQTNSTEQNEINVSSITALNHITDNYILYLRMYAWGATHSAGAFGFGYNSSGNTNLAISFTGIVEEIGISSTQNGNWSNPAIWQNNEVPDENDLVNINHQITTGNLSRNAKTNISSNGKLILEGHFQNNGITQVAGELIFRNNASISQNAPQYLLHSKLIYANSTLQNVGLEWLADSENFGQPHHVQLNSNAQLALDLNDNSRKINGNLSIEENSNLKILNNSSSIHLLTINDNCTINGNLELSNLQNTNLKLLGNIHISNNGNLTTNNNKLIFAKNGTQTMNSNSDLTLDYLELDSTSGTNLQLLTNVWITAKKQGEAIVFNHHNDIIDLNGKQLTIGTADKSYSITGNGLIKGGLYNTTSKITLLGKGNVTLNFAENFRYLNQLTLDKESQQIGLTLDSNLTITNLILNNGIIDTDSNTLIISNTGTITGANQHNFILTDKNNGGMLRKNFDGINNFNFTFPIGNATSAYSPATIQVGNANINNGYLSVTVSNQKHPNNNDPANYLKRYWEVYGLGITNTTNFQFSANYLPSDVVGDESSMKTGRFYTTTQNWTEGNAVNITQKTIQIQENSITISPTQGNRNVFTAGSIFVLPQISVKGNGVEISNQNQTTSVTNHTQFQQTKINQSNTRTFSVVNTGNGNLIISNLDLQGENASDFEITSYPNQTINPIIGLSNFTIKFNPTSTGEKNAKIVLQTNDPNFQSNHYVINIRAVAINHTTCEFEENLSVIAMNDFENNTNNNWSYTNSENLTIGNLIGFANSAEQGNSLGYIDSKSWQINNSLQFIKLDTINTTQLSEIEFRARIASLSTINNNGSDNSDYITVSISTNNGISWSEELKITGFQNSKWSFDSGLATAHAIYDGNNIIENDKIFKSTSGGYATIDGYGFLKISNLPQTENLSLKIEAFNNNDQEIWAIDHLELVAKKIKTKTWNGQNWLENNQISLPPTSSEAILFTNDFNVPSQNITGCQCTILPDVTLTIAPEKFLSIESFIDNKGTIVVENAGSIIQKDEFTQNNGIYSINRTTPPIFRYDYVYWSSPLTLDSQFTLYQLSPNTSPTKYHSWNPMTNAWNDHLNGNQIMIPGKGYIVRGPNILEPTLNIYPSTKSPFEASFTGKINNGTIQTPIHVDQSQFNLIGNPYPSAIFADDFLIKNQNIVEGAIYLWTHHSIGVQVNSNSIYSNDDYATYNLLGGVGITPSSQIPVPNGYIASGQGFFVKAKQSGDAIFENTIRVSNHNQIFYRNNNYEEKSRIWLNIHNSENFNQTLLGLCAQATDGLDWGYDATYFNNSSLKIYSVLGDNKLSIQSKSLPFSNNLTFAIGYECATSENLTISLDHFDGIFGDQNIYLEDTFLNTSTNLKLSNYSFYTQQGEYPNRFLISFMPQDNLKIEKNSTIENTVIVYKKQPNEIVIESLSTIINQVKVYDLTGRIIYKNENINHKTHVLNNLLTKNNLYFINIYLKNNAFIIKKISY